jgi:hypothetical protein
MRTYVCDWCSRPKKAGARWILGFAAERITSSGVQREISIEAAWSERRADHPLAVHFCSEAHKDFYVAALFRNHKRTLPTSSSRRKSSSRKRHFETSTGLGVVSVETDYETEVLPPIELLARKRRTTNSELKSLRFDAGDSIRSHGMSVRISGGKDGEERYNETDYWNGKR